MVTEIGSMTAEQIVADSRSATRCTTGRPSRRSSPLAIDRAEGVYMYGDRRHALPRLQLPADGREHRPRRQARRPTRSPGRPRRSPTSRRSRRSRTRAVLGEKLAELWPGDIEKTFFTLGGAEANENAVKIAKHGHGPPEGPGSVPQLPRVHVRHDDADRRPAPLAERAAADARRRARARPLPRPAARVRRRADRARARCEETIELEGPEHDRGLHPGDGHRHERHPDPARRLPAGRARALHRSSAS